MFPDIINKEELCTKPYLDLVRICLIFSALRYLASNSSGVRGSSGSISMYRSGIATLSGFDNWVEGFFKKQK